MQSGPQYPVSIPAAGSDLIPYLANYRLGEQIRLKGQTDGIPLGGLKRKLLAAKKHLRNGAHRRIRQVDVQAAGIDPGDQKASPVMLKILGSDLHLDQGPVNENGRRTN